MHGDGNWLHGHGKLATRHGMGTMESDIRVGWDLGWLDLQIFGGKQVALRLVDEDEMVINWESSSIITVLNAKPCWRQHLMAVTVAVGSAATRLHRYTA